MHINCHYVITDHLVRRRRAKKLESSVGFVDQSITARTLKLPVPSLGAASWWNSSEADVQFPQVFDVAVRVLWPKEVAVELVILLSAVERENIAVHDPHAVKNVAI
mmetsp:Transcript_16468/g.23137  ORF Transcript_16468/g.23137 Transcript_16468/m.23137 type:complete len:106 (-) Transcript_16468:13-330(-)